MKAVIIENDMHSLEIFEKAKEYLPNLQIIGQFSSIDKCEEFLCANQVDLVFVDLDIWPDDWKNIIQKLRAIDKKTLVVAISVQSDIYEDCYREKIISVLRKPITIEILSDTVDFVNEIRGQSLKKEIEIRTFGSFAVIVNELPLKFTRNKSKEILAYLIDKQGTAVSRKTLAAEVLNEDNYDERVINNLNTYIYWLKRDLKNAGILDILYNANGELAVVTTEFNCDLYLALAGDEDALKKYRGEYLYEYSWAEYKSSYLDRLKIEN